MDELIILTDKGYDELNVVEIFVESQNHGSHRYYTDEGLTIVDDNQFVINEIFCE